MQFKTTAEREQLFAQNNVFVSTSYYSMLALSGRKVLKSPTFFKVWEYDQTINKYSSSTLEAFKLY